jgi:hypothetical protein
MGETKKQENIEAIIDKAIPQIQDKAEAEKIDNDWLFNFIDKAKLISDSDMQVIWSKILSSEVNVPGMFSKRTISLVASMEKREADSFTKLCSFKIDLPEPVVIVYELKDEIYKQNEISFTMLKNLDSIGLISFEKIAGYKRTELPEHFFINYFDRKVEIKLPERRKNCIDIGSVLLTSSGYELINICGAQPKYEILEYILGQWKKRNITILYE